MDFFLGHLNGLSSHYEREPEDINMTSKLKDLKFAMHWNMPAIKKVWKQRKQEINNKWYSFLTYTGADTSQTSLPKPNQFHRQFLDSN